jgi:hypothetical protein
MRGIPPKLHALTSRASVAALLGFGATTVGGLERRGRVVVITRCKMQFYPWES